jgi:hypothetical protein
MYKPSVAILPFNPTHSLHFLRNGVAATQQMRLTEQLNAPVAAEREGLLAFKLLNPARHQKFCKGAHTWLRYSARWGGLLPLASCCSSC